MLVLAIAIAIAIYIYMRFNSVDFSNRQKNFLAQIQRIR
jgi:hypothetical protein